MGLENFTKIKKVSDSENNPVAKRNLFKKFANVALAAGILTLGTSDAALAKKQVKSQAAEKYRERILKNNPEYREKIEYLDDLYSDYLFEQLSIADKQAREAKGKIPARPKIIGFEKLGVDQKFLSKIFSEEEGCYPAGTINKNVAEVKFQNKVYKAQPKYGMQNDYVVGGVESLNKDNLIFFKAPQNAKYKGKELGVSYNARLIVLRLSHEIGHMHQGTFSNFMTPEQRIDFFVEVSRAYQTSELANTSVFRNYLAAIRNPNPNEKNYLITTEYWAILCEQYINYPEEFATLATPDEQKLIRKWLLKEKGKDFDPKNARDKRQYYAERMIADQIARIKHKTSDKAKHIAAKKQFRGKQLAYSRKR
ncbi:MAG: hypothetical protein WC858_00530 [Parcubacteria group bacterium]|jgi:hypothetical protein